MCGACCRLTGRLCTYQGVSVIRYVGMISRTRWRQKGMLVNPENHCLPIDVIRGSVGANRIRRRPRCRATRIITQIIYWRTFAVIRLPEVFTTSLVYMRQFDVFFKHSFKWSYRIVIDYEIHIFLSVVLFYEFS